MRGLLQGLPALLALTFPVPPLGPAYAQSGPKVAMEEFMVPAKDPGIQIYVRNKRPEGMSQFTAEKTVVFVHGATYPTETAFDLQLGGKSWMDYIAEGGFDVYMLDLRGYGKSTRPKEMQSQRTPTSPSSTPRLLAAMSGPWSTTSCSAGVSRRST